jgi:hypothetical protein
MLQTSFSFFCKLGLGLIPAKNGLIIGCGGIIP